jgi:sugar lactone lactonase YvrE
VPALRVDVAFGVRAQLGEGPVWDERTQTLWWVDIDRHLLWCQTPGASGPRCADIGEEVAAVLPREEEGLVLSLRTAVALTDRQLTITSLVPVLSARAGKMRLNDAACDPAGRLWFGSMATDGQLGRGALYTLAPDHSLSCARASVSVSNGLGWSPDGRTMYYVDTPTQRIDAFAFDVDSGRLGRQRTLATVPVSDGKPDGLAVDGDGSIWVALWGGGAVQQLSPLGRWGHRIELPTSNVTSCCFGGANLQELYITTARRGLASAKLATEPLAGAVFVCSPGTHGLPVTRFVG